MSLEELLATSKVVSLHLVPSDATKKLLNAQRLATMRPDSILVNTARGAIIGLTLDEKRVRFEVNLAAAHRAGLRLGSQLLKVAVRLIGQGPQGR